MWPVGRVLDMKARPICLLRRVEVLRTSKVIARLEEERAGMRVVSALRVSGVVPNMVATGPGVSVVSAPGR